MNYDCISMYKCTNSDVIYFDSRCWTVDMSGGEEAVQATNDDATSCKISAVSLGYWRDNFIQSMTR